MKWSEIKNSIINDLESRNLQDPKRRPRALEKLEKIMFEHYTFYVDNPSAIANIDKKEFINMLSQKKGRGLNDAEKSIVNEIYRRI